MNIPMRGVIEYGVRTLSLKGRAVLTSVVNEHRLELTHDDCRQHRAPESTVASLARDAEQKWNAIHTNQRLGTEGHGHC